MTNCFRELAKLAHKRMLPMALELNWEKRVGYNPVEYTLYRMKERRLLFRILIVTLVSFVLWPGYIISATSWAEDAVVAVVLVVVVVIGVMCMGLCVVAITHNTRDKQEIGGFLADIELLRDLSGKEWSELRWLGQKGLEALTDDILRSAARKVLEYKASGHVDPEHSDAERRRLEEVLETKYQAFERIGIAAEGYGRYYKLAQRQLAQERRRAQEPAASES